MTRIAGLVWCLLMVCFLPVSAQEASTQASKPAVSCSGDCRGLGIEKVKAGDEHCGFISRERKDKALDAACALSLENRQELEALARERSLDSCSNVAERDGCQCEVQFRRWQNIYTHVLSQRCWTECGWAAITECGPASVEDKAAAADK